MWQKIIGFLALVFTAYGGLKLISFYTKSEEPREGFAEIALWMEWFFALFISVVLWLIYFFIRKRRVDNKKIN